MTFTQTGDRDHSRASTDDPLCVRASARGATADVGRGNGNATGRGGASRFAGTVTRVRCRTRKRCGALRNRCGVLRRAGDAGMSTAEYAVGTVAACGFAALLWTIVHSSVVQNALSGLLTKALTQL